MLDGGGRMASKSCGGEMLSLRLLRQRHEKGGERR